MLFGWMTAGKLACPHCMSYSKSFTLRYGHKSCWFDCHQMFLPSDHPYRRDTCNFTRGVTEEDAPSPNISGDDILRWLMSNVSKVTYEGRASKIDGYGVNHNFIKQSIFWELPYWKDHLVRA